MTFDDQDFLRRVPIDVWTNLRANEFCADDVADANFFNLLFS